MYNNIYGKCLANVSEREDIRLVTDKLIQKINMPTKLIREKQYFLRILQRYRWIKQGWNSLNLHIYVGMSILELSKSLMYDFHFNYVKPKYTEKTQLLFTDTDSLLYQIEIKDIYKDIENDIEDKFDNTNYLENH